MTTTRKPKTERPNFSSRLAALPVEPGVYLMKDAGGNVIYVGKAQALRNRVRSYFQTPRGHDPKTRELVTHIRDFEVIRTDTPTEALILENTLIKRYLPKYNVMLKDNSTYPYLKITEEEWPRIHSTRVIANDGGRYFGPYPSAGKAYDTLNLLNRLFPYRKCEKKITGHDDVCLYYHLKQCTAPCISAVDRDTYMHSIDAASLFLSGRGEEILHPLEEEMNQASDAWNFERAAELRDRVKAVKHVLERQKVVSTSGANQDVVAAAQGAGGDAGIQVAFVRSGKIFGSEFFPMHASLGEPVSQIVSGFVSQFYSDSALVPPTIVLQHALPEEDRDVVTAWLRERRGGRVEVLIPSRGEKKKLVEMVAKSAADNLEQNRLKFLNDEQRTTGALTELATALDLPQLPRRIECYDISNVQGTNSVASMVVFEAGKPAKKEYRKFKIKTVEGANDFASMKEVIGRRFKRASEIADVDVGEPAPDPPPNGVADSGPRPPAPGPDDAKWTVLPDLVIVDGGKGQLNAALEALRETNCMVPICGLAKENEEIFLPARVESILLPRDSQALYLVQRVRDEAHRFANAFHQQRRQKTTFASALDEIPGLGPKRRRALMLTFGSVKAIRDAPVEELAKVDGVSLKLAETVKSSLSPAPIPVLEPA